MTMFQGFRTVACAVALAASASSIASAEGGFPAAAFGNTEGCHYAKTGESSGADVFFLLNTEAITTAASYCAFSKPPQLNGTAYTATVDCEEEGQKAEPQDITITPSVDGTAMTVTFSDGTNWGPLPKCE
ncbi:hypothetical protein [Pararhizobium arenae]|uniref:hypothetical protein n=1 Tax=Pararhizobium arenae TaxID=1856850 RepID=UPI000A89CBB9|nr:hypothetical protein [Pararhizobium arenae]